MNVYRTKSGFFYKQLKSGKKKRISKDEYLKLSKSKQIKKISPKKPTYKIYRSKNGYFYKELKSGKKKRISKKEYLKSMKIVPYANYKSKAIIKGGSPDPVVVCLGYLIIFFIEFTHKDRLMTTETKGEIYMGWLSGWTIALGFCILGSSSITIPIAIVVCGVEFIAGVVLVNSARSLYSKYETHKERLDKLDRLEKLERLEGSSDKSGKRGSTRSKARRSTKHNSSPSTGRPSTNYESSSEESSSEESSSEESSSEEPPRRREVSQKSFSEESSSEEPTSVRSRVSMFENLNKKHKGGNTLAALRKDKSTVIEKCEHVKENPNLRRIFYQESDEKCYEMCEHHCWNLHKIYKRYFKEAIPEHITLFNKEIVQNQLCKSSIPFHCFIPPRDTEIVTKKEHPITFKDFTKNTDLQTFFVKAQELWKTELETIAKELSETVYCPQVMNKESYNSGNREVSEFKIQYSSFDAISPKNFEQFKSKNFDTRLTSIESYDFDIVLQSHYRFYMFQIKMHSNKPQKNESSKGIVFTKAIGLIFVIVSPDNEKTYYCICNGYKEGTQEGTQEGFRFNKSKSQEYINRKADLENMDENKLKLLFNHKLKYMTDNQLERRFRNKTKKYNKKKHGSNLVELILNEEFENRKQTQTAMLVFEMTSDTDKLQLGNCKNVYSNKEVSNETLQHYRAVFPVLYKNKKTALSVNNNSLRLNKDLPAPPSKINNMNNMNFIKSLNSLKRLPNSWEYYFNKKPLTNIKLVKLSPNKQSRQLLKNMHSMRRFFKIDAIILDKGVLSNQYKCGICDGWAVAKGLFSKRNRKTVLLNYPKEHRTGCFYKIYYPYIYIKMPKNNNSTNANLTKIKFFVKELKGNALKEITVTQDGTEITIKIDDNIELIVNIVDVSIEAD